MTSARFGPARGRSPADWRVVAAPRLRSTQETPMPRWLLAVLVVSVLVLLAVAAKPILLPAGNPRHHLGELRAAQGGNAARRGGVYSRATRRLPHGADAPESSVLVWDQLPCPSFLSVFPLPPPEQANVSVFFSHPALVWQVDESEVQVWLGPDGRVSRGVIILMDPEPVGLLDRLRWRWNRWRESRR